MRKSKDEIIAELTASFNLLALACDKIPDEDFNISKDNKWTPAENYQHLLTSTKVTVQAYTLPRFLLRLLYGRPKTASQTYSKVVNNYHERLSHGAKASGVYVPKKVNYDKARLKTALVNAGEKLTVAIQRRWNEEQLDAYGVKHPVLGFLTLRELAYFTIYHNTHHLSTIENTYL